MLEEEICIPKNGLQDVEEKKQQIYHINEVANRSFLQIRPV